jgi:hypothetical protein
VILKAVAEQTVSNQSPKVQVSPNRQRVGVMWPTSMVVFLPALDSTMHTLAVTEVLVNLSMQSRRCKVWPPFRANLKVAIRRSELFQLKQ